VSEFREHSYIRRRGRATQAQSRALAVYTARYAVEPEQIGALAGTECLGIEIGFGMGHALLRWATDAPQWRLLGIELYQPGIGALSDGLYRQSLHNVWVLEYPAQVVFAALPDARVDEVRIFFPDPWPKKRHHKRRLIQPDFVQELARTLKSGAVVRLATDWTPYAEWIRECFASCAAFEAVLDAVRGARTAATEASVRDTTNFERRGERLGHDVTDLVYRRN